MRMLKNLHYVPLLLLLILGCEKAESPNAQKTPLDYDSRVVREWFALECTIVKETEGFFPPQAARAFGYMGITAYESVVKGWPEAKSLTGQLTGFDEMFTPFFDEEKQYQWEIVANAALSDMMRYMFQKKISAENLAKIDELEQQWLDQLNTGIESAVKDRSVAYGKAVAAGIYEYSKTDGGHEQYVTPFQLPYTWPTNAGAWKPTGAALNPLAPNWKSNRPFLPENIAEAQPTPHMPFSTAPNSEFYKAALDVYNIVKSNTEEEVEITKFWADDPFNTCTPTGHTFNILGQLLEENDASLGMAVVGYARLGIAENDAFICCWKTKYDYFLVRPVTYIKEYIDPSFTTVIGTPPFPAYTSGHATESAAGSRIFTDMFTDGDGYYQFTDRTQLQFGFSVRNFNNFDEMAEECANSRLYGGIHYNTDNLNGLKMGKSIGDNVNKRIDWPSVK
jgi:hypothetical protein